MEEILRVNEFLDGQVDITPERLRKLSDMTLGNRTSSLLLNRSNTSAFSTPTGRDTLAEVGGADDTLLNEFSFFFNEKNAGNETAKNDIPIENLLHPTISRGSSTTIGVSVTGKGQKLGGRRPRNPLVLFDEEIMLDRNQMFMELQILPIKKKKKGAKMEEVRRMLLLPFDDITAKIFFSVESVEADPARLAKNSSMSYSTIPPTYWNDDYQADFSNNHLDYDCIDDPIGRNSSPADAPEINWLSDFIKQKSKAPLIFNELIKTRRQACKAFYSLLMCINRQMVKVEQLIPFGPIIVM